MGNYTLTTTALSSLSVIPLLLNMVVELIIGTLPRLFDSFRSK